jgi:hypothetical protein
LSGFGVGDTSMNQKIQILISSNEQNSTRSEGLEWAMSEDSRFMKPIYSSEILVDVQFSLSDTLLMESDGITTPGRIGFHRPYTQKIGPDEIFNCELKKVEDYITLLNKEGHIRNQYLDMAEQGHPSMFLVLGGDQQVSSALKNDLYKRGFRGTELDFKLEENEDRIRDFEAQCFAMRCPVMRWQNNPFKRLLSTAHKVLTGGSLMGYGPRPQDYEREIVACNSWMRGVGDKTWAEVLKEYRLALVPRGEYAKPIEEIKGVGEKRAKDIGSKIVMWYGALI